MPASISFTLPELNNDVLSVSINFSPALMREIIAAAVRIPVDEDGDDVAREHCTEIENIVLRSLQVNRIKFLDDSQHSKESSPSGRPRKRARHDDAAAAGTIVAAPTALDLIEQATNPLVENIWNVVKPGCVSLQYLLDHKADDCLRIKNVQPWRDMSFHCLPSALAMHCFDFIAFDLVSKQGEWQFREVIGRWSNQQDRDFRVVFRSLRLRYFGDDTPQRELELEQDSLWNFIAKQVRYFFVYMQEDQKPLGFEWLLNHASPRRTPALVSAGVFDDGVLQGYEASSMDWASENSYFNSKVEEITTSSCDCLNIPEARRLGEKLTRLSLYYDISQMPELEQTLKTKAPLLDNLSFEVQERETLEKTVRVAEQLPKMNNLQVTVLTQNEEDRVDSSFFACFANCTIKKLYFDTYIYGVSLASFPFSAHVKCFSLYAFALESLEGIEAAMNLERIGLSFADFETVGLERLLTLSKLEFLYLQDNGDAGFSPTLKRVLREFLYAGRLTSLGLQLKQKHRQHAVMDDDILELFGSPQSKSNVKTFRLQVRNHMSYQDDKQTDSCEQLLTHKALIPLVLSPALRHLVIDIPGFDLNQDIVNRIIQLNLLDTLSTTQIFGNEEY